MFTCIITRGFLRKESLTAEIRSFDYRTRADIFYAFTLKRISSSAPYSGWFNSSITLVIISIKRSFLFFSGLNWRSRKSLAFWNFSHYKFGDQIFVQRLAKLLCSGGGSTEREKCSFNCNGDSEISDRVIEFAVNPVLWTETSFDEWLFNFRLNRRRTRHQHG